MSVMLGWLREVSSICAWAPKSLHLSTVSAPLELQKLNFFIRSTQTFQVYSGDYRFRPIYCKSIIAGDEWLLRRRSVSPLLRWNVAPSVSSLVWALSGFLLPLESPAKRGFSRSSEEGPQGCHCQAARLTCWLEPWLTASVLQCASPQKVTSRKKIVICCRLK